MTNQRRLCDRDALCRGGRVHARSPELTPVSRRVAGVVVGNVRNLISIREDAIILVVKQLLLRVPEDVHRRLAARAAREGRSVNALATQILDAAAEGDTGDRRARLRAAAAAAGSLRPLQARGVTAARRRRVIESTRGLGAQVDRLLADERDRV